MAFYQLASEVTPQEVGVDGEALKKVTDMFHALGEAPKLLWRALVVAYGCWTRGLDTGCGFGRVSDQKLVTPETMFVLFSSTKGLTALAMHMLRDQGRFDYDDLVARYWPEFARNGKGSATITHVLGHRVGITI